MKSVIVRKAPEFLADLVIYILIETRTKKQVVEEQMELVKYSKLKSLANTLYEYVVLISFHLLMNDCIDFLGYLVNHYLMTARFSIHRRMLSHQHK
jgi:hypothetical protein